MAKHHLIGFMTCAALLANAAHAQNLILNPYFENHLVSWQYDPPNQVSWTSTVDYSVPDSDIPGSMVLDGSLGPVLALQCVTVLDSIDYVASMRVKSHCAGQTLNVFWTNATCDTVPTFISAASTHPDEWDLVTLLAQPTAGAHGAIVVAENPGGCTSPAYVDDVTFQKEAIFADGFEPPVMP